MTALAIDLAIVALTATMAWRGFRQGLTIHTLTLIGFGIGALLGSRLAPLVLEDGLQSSFAPVLALPGALIAGGLLAALVERVAFRHQQRLDRLGSADGPAGAVLAGLLGLVAAWLLGTAVAQIGSLRDAVESSVILGSLNVVLPPPGPVLAAETEPIDRFPTLDGPAPRVPSADPSIARDPEVRTAGSSVVRIVGEGCGGGAQGSGWVARDGIVVTNAHVVAGTDTRTVQPGGKGPLHAAEVVFFDREQDLALLRTRGLGGVSPLELQRNPRAGLSAAALGFPGGRREVRPARLGNTTETSSVRMQGTARTTSVAVTSFVGRIQPGNSGGPMVDTRGRVVTTVFAKSGEGFGGYGVPNAFVRRALSEAGSAPVDTGPCEV